MEFVLSAKGLRKAGKIICLDISSTTLIVALTLGIVSEQL